MTDINSPLLFSKNTRTVIAEKIWFMVFAGLVGAIIGYFYAEKIPHFNVRTALEIGFFYQNDAIFRAVDQNQLANEITADIHSLASDGIKGVAYPRTPEFSKNATKRQKGYRYILISLQGPDAPILNKHLDAIVSKHLAIHIVKEKDLIRKHKIEPIVKTKEIVFPFSKTLSNKASRLMLPALYAAFGMTLAFIGLLLLEWLKRRKKA